MIQHGPGLAFIRTVDGNWEPIGRTVCGTCNGQGYLLFPLRMCPFGCRPDLATLTALAQLW